MSEEPTQEQRKIIFLLEQDEDDYPPVGAESMWATCLSDGTYQVANIPFFVRDVSPDDVICTIEEDGVAYFDHVLTPSASSVLRVVFFETSIIAKTREELEILGCDTELSGVHDLISVEVPAEVDYDVVIDFLGKGTKRGDWEYETASIRH